MGAGTPNAFVPPQNGPSVGSTGGGTGNFGAISAGTQLASSGTVILSNSNGLSFGMSGSHTITAAFDAIKSISAGTAQASGPTLVFSNLNNVSFGITGNTITASIQTAGGTASGVGISAGTEVATTGAVIFSNSNGLTFGLHNQTLTASYTQAPETPFGVSAGSQSVSTGTLVFANSNGITFGMSGSNQITASYTQAPETPFGVSAGSQSVSTGTLVFANSNGITFGMAGSSQITASVSTQPGTPFGVSAGTQSVSTGTLSFANSNGITFGMSGSSQITASYSQSSEIYSNLEINGFAGQVNVSQNRMSFNATRVPAYITATNLMFLAGFSCNSGSSGSVAISFGVYTRNHSTANLASSTSVGYSWTSGSDTSDTNQQGGISGFRYRTLAGPFNFTPGDYLFAYQISTVNNVSVTFCGKASLSAGVASFATGGESQWLDGFSNSSLTAFPATVGVLDTNYLRNGAGHAMPGIVLLGTY